ncbi:uncharacterized protein F4822DRAFT_428863 [Hypoxylon trugodes]|uniref:uncharacterized protein n=1 Tax=Hypoxylon trugodes TaxID=326681 RepID=UPI00219B77CA|nr:uncharacterized protein F4822DRAFT_428863 [Hypoxylon trugodes]KAI1388241.1 hypothetical protein F4822DRAFT_428863 [Hypoxylon trugodes]
MNPIRPSQPVVKPTVQTRPVPQHYQTHELGLATTKSLNLSMAPSQIYSSVQSAATTLVPQIFQRASAPSVVSHVKSVDLGSHEDLVYPPRPGDASRNLAEATCPYCLYVLSSLEISGEARWRKHILGDLDALVCLFGPCDEPNVLYKHSRDWLQHMRKHTRRWRCSAKVHGILEFNSCEEFENHMRSGHGKQYTSAQLGLLAEKAMRSSGPLFEVCPLCGGEDDEGSNLDSGDLIDHIVVHLRTLALKSLPPHYGDDDNASSNTHDNESTKSRNTVKIFLNEYDVSFSSPSRSPVPMDDIQIPLELLGENRHETSDDDNAYNVPDSDEADWQHLLKTALYPTQDTHDPIK